MMLPQGPITDFLNHDWVQFWLLPGLTALALAIWAGIADRRRLRRNRPDAVGWMPWQGIGFWSSFAALLLLGAALRGWLTTP
ncbi:hypothetical protein [Novosphingobium sp.]|uniref:hypothetical protein n=1 Tax=Novosphingobium sp. TaxID=1874826 RepID=UPI0035B2C8A5